VDHRSDVEPGGLAKVAGLVAVVAGHGDDQVLAIDDDLRPGDTQPVDAGTDDLLGLCQGFTGWGRAIGGACCQRDACPALQIDAKLGLGLLVAGEEHQQINTDQ
jgi:hypothetical protein